MGVCVGVCEGVGVEREENDSELVGEPLLDPGEPKGIPGDSRQGVILGGNWAFAAISQESSDLLLLLLLLLPPPR